MLASSLLRLGETPWLSQCLWGTEDVFLLNLKQRAQMMANPYVRHNFSPGTVPTALPPSTIIPNKLVFALGVMLIELSYAKPLIHFKEPADGDHPYTNLEIASRLVQDLDS